MDEKQLRLECLKLAVDLVRSGASDDIFALAAALFHWTMTGEPPAHPMREG